MDATELRLRLLANGYSPIANRDKACYLAGWPTIEITEDVLRKWGRSRRFAATGIRVENGLAVIDVDIDDAIVETILRTLDRAFPALAAAPLRHSGGDKFALFIRTDEPFGRLHTRRWVAPGQTAEDGAHVVEVYGGASPRQFGAFGPHTVDPDGTVRKTYDWDGDSLLDVPLAELPLIPKVDLFAICDMVEKVLEEHGFEVMPQTTRGENEAERVYDLDDTMRFKCIDGEERSLEAMRMIAGQHGMRCSAEWQDGYRGNASLTRCLLGQTHNGHMTIWDSATGVTHMEAALAPKDRTSGLKRLKGALRVEDGMFRTVGKLLESYGLCPDLQPNVVVPFDPAQAPLTMATFRTYLQPYVEVEIGPRGGEKRINPADVWAASPLRTELGGIRLRPEMDRPLFKEHGRTYLNSYEPPEHPPGGTPDMGVELIAHLTPNSFERRWFTQWLAFKYRNPHIPGPAVIMVAREFGTGRGTLGEIAGALFGERYVLSVPFDTFAGRTYQSQYTDWAADTLLAVVNESSTSDHGSTYRAKHDTYEHLKETIEVRPTERYYISKKGPSFRGPSHTSYLIATNNADALPIPAGDRRFAVLTNGGRGTAEFWEAVNAWREKPENIGALARWLEAVDLSGYSPFAAPIETTAKAAMTELSRSDIDRAFEIVMDSLPGKLMVQDQVVAGMRQIERTHADINYPPGDWVPAVSRMVRTTLCRVGDMRPSIGDKKHLIYARTQQAAAHWEKQGVEDIRREVLKNGSPSASGLPGNVINIMQERTKQHGNTNE